MTSEFTENRGNPWEHDPGPPRNRKWPRLFSEVPNYRAFGVALTGEEEHRWHFGPMFYRGRLSDDSIKVLIVGQEGAQDECLSHRSFTGSTGARLQFFLNHLGITESYLFLNTFAYPIFGQYNGELPTIAQHPSSPVAQHRAKLFDYAFERNDIRLLVGVGRAAKESIATYIQNRGGNAHADELEHSDSNVLGENVRAIGVHHPGGGTNPDQRQKIIDDFRRAIQQITDWENLAPGWLSVDQGGVRQAAEDYQYGKAPIPFRDFPYGTNWRLGRGSTSSNRFENQEWIQLFGAGGQYANFDILYRDQSSSAVVDSNYRLNSMDLPYEPPTQDFDEFDNGPEESMARLLQGGSTNFPWPDFVALGLSHNPSFGHGPIYRGRPEEAKLLVIADQQGHDDLFTCRALTCNVGQHLQAFLESAGMTSSYAILRTLPIDTSTSSPTQLTMAVDHPDVRALLAEVIRRINPQVILSLGSHASRVAADDAPENIPIVTMADFRRSGDKRRWKPAMTQLAELSFDRDLVNPKNEYDGSRLPIPRQDLPWGTLCWQATHGDRAQQGYAQGLPTTDYYRLRMPTWVATLPPAPLSEDEQKAIDILSDGGNRL